MAKGPKIDWQAEVVKVTDAKTAKTFADIIQKNIQSFFAKQNTFSSTWLNHLSNNDAVSFYEALLNNVSSKSSLDQGYTTALFNYINSKGINGFFEDAVNLDTKQFSKKWDYINNKLQYKPGGISTYQGIPNKVLKSLDSTKATQLFNNLQEYTKLQSGANNLLAIIDGNNATHVKNYGVFDNVLKSYRINKLTNQGVDTVLRSFTSSDDMKRAYVEAGLTDSSLKDSIAKELVNNQSTHQNFLKSLTKADSNIIDALYNEVKNSNSLTNPTKGLDNFLNNYSKDVSDAFFDKVRTDYTTTHNVNGKTLPIFNAGIKKQLQDYFLSKNLITEQDTEMIKDLANRADYDKLTINNAKVEEAFNNELLNRALSSQKDRVNILTHLANKNALSNSNASIIEQMAADGSNLTNIRQALNNTPELQKALDNFVYKEFQAAPDWSANNPDPTAAIQNTKLKNYMAYVQKNFPTGKFDLDTLKALKGNISVEEFNKKVDTIPDSNLRKTIKKAIASAENSIQFKKDFKIGDNPWADEKAKDLNWSGRKAYLNNVDIKQLLDANDSTGLSQQGKDLGLDKLQQGSKEYTEFWDRANRPEIAHPKRYAWQQARQSLADFYNSLGNPNAKVSTAQSLADFKKHMGTALGFGGGSSSSGADLGIKNYGNLAKGLLVGGAIGYPTEKYINEPLREAMGGAQTGNRALDAATDFLTNPTNGLINTAMIPGGMRGFIDAKGTGILGRTLGTAGGMFKYGLSPQNLGLAALMAGGNQARDAANVSSNNAAWQALQSTVPWIQYGATSMTPWMWAPTLTAGATAAISNAAMNAQTERLGMRDTGKRYAAGADMVGKDIDNYKGYVFLGRDGKAKDIYQIKQEMIAKGLAPSDAQDYIDTNYMAYTPEFVKGIVNHHVNRDPDWMERVERALTFYDKDGNPTGRIKPADETGNHLTDTLDYAQKMATTSIANDGILGGLARMGKLAMLGAEGAWNELARGNTMEYKNGDPKRAVENWFAYNRQAMNKQAKEAKAQQPKATSIKQEAEQQAAAQEAAQQEAAQTVAAIQQAQQAYQAPQVGINLASLTPMGGQNASGIDDLLAMYNMQQTPQGMPNLANFA